MSLDPRKRQKKKEKQAAKRKAKHRELVGGSSTAGAVNMASAASFPIHDCWISESLWSGGIGYVGLSRELPDGSIACAMFLVDRYCLGIKNVLSKKVGRFTYGSMVQRLGSETGTQDTAPAAARKFIDQAVDYARSLGFSPHADFLRAYAIFGDIDASACTDEFEFGKEGKPFFISGPNETTARCRQIVNTLEERCGPDGYHYLVGIGSSDVEALQLSSNNAAANSFLTANAASDESEPADVGTR
jgi:hypothetical protein